MISRRNLFGGIGAAALSYFLPSLKVGQRLPESDLSSRLRAFADILESPLDKLLEYDMIVTHYGNAVSRMKVLDVFRKDVEGKASVTWKGIFKTKNKCMVDGLQVISPKGIVFRSMKISTINMDRYVDTLNLSYTICIHL